MFRRFEAKKFCTKDSRFDTVRDGFIKMIDAKHCVFRLQLLMRLIHHRIMTFYRQGG